MDDPTQPVPRSDLESAELLAQPTAPPVAEPAVQPEFTSQPIVVAPLPGSVVAAAVVLLVMGVLAGLFAAVMFLSGASYGRLPDSSFGNLTPDDLDAARRLGGAVVISVGVTAGVVALGHLGSGIGILRRAGWGRVIGMIFAGIGLLFTGLLALLSAVLLAARLPASTISGSGMTPEQYEQLARIGGIAGLVIFGVCALAYLFALIALIRNGQAFH